MSNPNVPNQNAEAAAKAKADKDAADRLAAEQLAAERAEADRKAAEELERKAAAKDAKDRRARPATFKVAPGRSVTSKRGILDAGAEVDPAKDLEVDEARLEELLKLGALVRG